MEEQVKEQFEKFQNGWTAAIDASSKTALAGNEVVLDSFGQLLKDQAEFGRVWMNIGRKQAESLAADKDVTALFNDTGAPADYYAAATQYGEALRKNATDVFTRMTAINREAADTFVKACSQG